MNYSKINTVKFLIISLVLVSNLLALLFTEANACSCGGAASLGGRGVGGPVITIPASTLPKGKVAVTAGWQYQNHNEFGRFHLSQINSRREHAHNFSSLARAFLALQVGVTDDLDIALTLPYNFLFDLQSTFGGRTFNEGDSIGFGDLSILARYHLIDLDRFDFALLAGVKLATGDYSEFDDNGFLLAADHQPGTGSWDPLMGFAVGTSYKDYNFDANTLYQLSTRSRGPGLIIGDLLLINAAVSKPLYFGLLPEKILGMDASYSASLESNMFWRERTEFDSIKDDAHGGFGWLATGGLRMGLSDKIILTGAVTLPIFQNLNGSQPPQTVGLFSSLTYVF